MGAQQARADIQSLGPAGQQAGAAIKAGTAHAWTPFIGQMKKAEEEQKRLADEAQKTANAQVSAARKAAAAVVSAAKDQKDALRQVAIAEKDKADAAIQASRAQARAYQQASQAASAAQRGAASQMVSRPSGVSGAVQQIAGAEKLQAAQTVAGAFSGFFDKRRASIDSGVEVAETKESEIATIEALQGSREKALETYEDIDKAALKSVFDLEKLTAAGKNLAAGEIYSTRNLRAVDDIAAVGKNRGVTPEQTSFALTRLQNGDFGEGFQRFRELGLNRKELEGQGLKFSASNQFEGTAEQAVEGVVKAIEKKFGGLSEKLATETTMGAVDQLGDAQKRYAGAIQGELLPAINLEAQALTGITTLFADMPKPLRVATAYTGAFITGVGQLGGGLITTAATAGQALLAYTLLTGGTGAAGASAGTASIGVNTLGGSLMTRLVPALLTTGLVIGKVALVAVLAAAALYALDKLLHKKEDDALKANIEAGEAADKEFYDKQVVRRDAGKKSDVKAGETFEGWQKRMGRGQENSEDKRESGPGIDPSAIQSQITSLTGSLGADQSAAGAAAGTGAGVNSAVMGTSPDAAIAQIRALEDEKAGASKERKLAIAAQIRALRRQQQDARAAQVSANKVDREGEKAANETEKKAEEAAKDANEAKGYAVDLEVAKEDAKGSNYLAALEDERDKAKEDRDGAAVEAYTLQIETFKAEVARYHAQAEADKLTSEDKAKHDFLYQKSEIEFEGDMNEARRTARKSGRDAEKEGGKKKRDDAIRRALSAMRGAVLPSGGSGFSALNPAGSAASVVPQSVYDFNGANVKAPANRFEQSGFWNGERVEMMKSLWNGGQVGGGYSRGVPGIGDLGASGSGRTGNQSREIEVQLRSGGVTQKAGGAWLLKILPPDDIEIPYQGIGNLRGRGRR